MKWFDLVVLSHRMLTVYWLNIFGIMLFEFRIGFKWRSSVWVIAFLFSFPEYLQQWFWSSYINLIFTVLFIRLAWSSLAWWLTFLFVFSLQVKIYDVTRKTQSRQVLLNTPVYLIRSKFNCENFVFEFNKEVKPVEQSINPNVFIMLMKSSSNRCKSL